MRCAPTVALVLVCSAICATSRGEDDNTAAVVDGLLARCDAIFSGRFAFTEKIVSPTGQIVNEVRIKFAFSGSDWIKRVPPQFGQPESVFVSYGGNSLHYIPTRQADGSITKLARVNPGSKMGSTDVRPPTFAGTLWSAKTKDYIAANKRAVQNLGREKIHNLSCVKLVCNVSGKDTRTAFDSFVSDLHTGGSIVLYVSPDFGYACPKIEYRLKSGDIGFSFDSSDLIPVGRGIYFPQTCDERSYVRTNAPPHLHSYIIQDIIDINESIPNSTFVVNVPSGTEVLDNRERVGSRYILSDSNKDIKGLEDIVASDAGSVWGRNRTTAVITGIAIGLSALVLLFIRRSWRARRSPK